MAAGDMSEKQLEALIRLYKELNLHAEQMNTGIKGMTVKQAEHATLVQKISNTQMVINELQKEMIAGNTKVEGQLNRMLADRTKLVREEKNLNYEIQQGIKWRQRQVDLAKEFGRQIKVGWQYLQQSDKIIRQTILSLGMSGVKAEQVRKSFEESAGYVARLGGNMEDIRDIMTVFADRTGRARALTDEMVQDITLIGKGTALGVEQAAQLGAQFEFMGLDARSTMEYVQGVVDTSERMGVNTTKVLKNINDNFKKLNTYTFVQGVKGLAEMAQYAEKFRVDITEALSAADVARSLEGAIDLAAQLQIMGGEFAKTDPFEMLFLSRNDPAEFTKKISEMTRGVVTFRKNSEGIMEKFISPADRDRLRNVAQALGMSVEEITEIAQRRADMDKMAQQMAGLGLTTREKELIEGAAVFNSEQGRFMVTIGGQMKDITTMNSEQVKLLETEQKTLEDRAIAAQTFEDALKATIDMLKASLLPALRAVNKVLERVQPVITGLAKWLDGFERPWLRVLTAAGMLIAGAAAWKFVSIKLGDVSENFLKSGKLSGKGPGRGVSGILGGKGGATPTPGTPGSMFTKTGMIRKGAPELTRAKGLASLSKGVGAGAAGAGVGAGIMMGAKGIGELAQAIKDVDVEKLKTLNGTIAILGGTFVAILVPAMFALGAAGPFAALGLAALGAAAVGVGFGINLATKGVAQMAEGLAKLNASGGGAGKEILGVATGVGALTLAMTAGGGIIGLTAFNFQLKRMAKHSDELGTLGAAFAGLGATINSLPNVKTTVDAISSIDVTGLKNTRVMLHGVLDDFIEIERAINTIKNTRRSEGGVLTELTRLLKTPLKVEFADKQVAVVSNVTLEIDGEKFHRMTKTGAYVRNSYNDSKAGLQGNG